MPLPIRHLPVLQNWDCHVCGTCCQEYLVTVTDEEKKRIDAQGWDRDKDLGGFAPFVRHGPPWARKWRLNHRPDGSCVFLSDKGRCRVHERHGYETKPLPCRLFPFVLIPTGDHWSVGLRYACPSAAANKGRPLPEHDPALKEFAARLAEREKLAPRPDGSLTPPPSLQPGLKVSWPDVHRVVEALLALLRNRKEPLERRLRKCLALGEQMRKANLKHLTAARLGDLLTVLQRLGRHAGAGQPDEGPTSGLGGSGAVPPGGGAVHAQGPRPQPRRGPPRPAGPDARGLALRSGDRPRTADARRPAGNDLRGGRKACAARCRWRLSIFWSAIIR